MNGPNPIGLQLYSVRSAMAEDFEGTLSKTKALGYDGVEFAGLFGQPAADVRRMLKDAGLKPVSAHVPIPEMLAAPEMVMQAYATIGCRYITVPWLDEQRRPGGPLFGQTILDLQKLAALAGEYQLTLLYHNHDFEFVKIDGMFALDLLFKQVPQMETEIDTCWVHVAGQDPAAYIRQYARRSPVVHLKDYFQSGDGTQSPYELIGDGSKAKHARDDSFEFRPVGEGMQAFPGVLRAALDSGAFWFVIEQDQPTPGLTDWECAKRSIRNLQQMMETL